MATIPTGDKIRGALADGGIRRRFLICAHFCAVIQGVLCSQARLGALLCGGGTCEKGIQRARWPHTLTRASQMNVAQSSVHLGCRHEGQSDLWVGRNQRGPIERRANMPHNDFGTSHFLFTHYGHLKIKRTPVSPHGSKCEHLWQEHVRPDFYSQWQRGAVWPAAELKIVQSGLARHTRT